MSTTISEKFINEKEFYSLVIRRVEYLKSEDNSKLKTIIVRPDCNKPLPTILMRTCYPKNEEKYLRIAEMYAHRGFNYIFQICRGVGDSTGQWKPNVNERIDGINLLKWCEKQDWIESIGIYGFSYSALAGWVLMNDLTSKVKTMYLSHYGTERFVSAYRSGLFRHDVLTSWTRNNAGKEIDVDYETSLNYRPHIQVDRKLWGVDLPWYREWILNTDENDSYWNTGFWKYLRDIPLCANIPIYIGSGWYDHHLGSTMVSYDKLNKCSKSRSVLRIGAWNHSFKPCVEGRILKNLENDENYNAYKWFRKILIDGEEIEKKIHLYDIGNDVWEEFNEYPLKIQPNLYLYLDTNHKTLLEDCPLDEGVSEFIYDPNYPVYSIGSESLLETKRWIGSLLQPPEDYREDVITFISNEFEDDVTILGKIELVLYVSSDAEDTAFSAKIMEKQKNGKSYSMRSSIVTISKEIDYDYIPDSIVKVTLTFWDIFWTIKAGNRLRIDISSSDFPQYSLHPNTKQKWSIAEKFFIANQKVYTGGDKMSYIKLPLKK